MFLKRKQVKLEVTASLEVSIYGGKDVFIRARGRLLS